MTDAGAPEPNGLRPPPWRVWLSRPAGLPFELFCVLVLFAIPALLVFGGYGENLRALVGASTPCLCGTTHAHSVEKRLEHFGTGGAPLPGEAAGPATPTHTH